MTECERLVSSGIIDAAFFEEEIRNDFTVDIERKKIWAVELGLLIELDRVCKKYNLKYFLWAGTLLGAIRHKGFIPWDDDLDVVMLRKDYEELLVHADEFKNPYFLQTPLTDPEAGYSHAKVRNSNTTAFNKLWGYRNYNQGIYIDIFPIDDKCGPDLEERINQIESLETDSSLYMKMPSPYKNERDIKRIEQRSSNSVKDNYESIQNLMMKYSDPDSKEVIRAIASTFKTIDKMTYSRSDFKDVVMVEFENMLFPAPCAYERILENLFGNYMEFPPIEKRVNKHSHTIFDADISYLKFIKPSDVEADDFYKTYIEYGRNPNLGK